MWHPNYTEEPWVTQNGERHRDTPEVGPGQNGPGRDGTGPARTGRDGAGGYVIRTGVTSDQAGK